MIYDCYKITTEWKIRKDKELKNFLKSNILNSKYIRVRDYSDESVTFVIIKILYFFI